MTFFTFKFTINPSSVFTFFIYHSSYSYPSSLLFILPTSFIQHSYSSSLSSITPYLYYLSSLTFMLFLAFIHYSQISHASSLPLYSIMSTSIIPVFIHPSPLPHLFPRHDVGRHDDWHHAYHGSSSLPNLLHLCSFLIQYPFRLFDLHPSFLNPTLFSVLPIFLS